MKHTAYSVTTGALALVTVAILYQSSCSPSPPVLEIPFDGPGKLVTIWIVAPGAQGTRLVVTLGGASRELRIEESRMARWRTDDELIVETWPSRAGAQGSRILRVSAEGNILQTLSDGEWVGGSVPAKNERWVAVQRINERGNISVTEIRDIENGFEVQRVHEFPPELERFDVWARVSGTIWSPDADRFAVAVWIRSQTGGTFWPTLCVFPRDGNSPVGFYEEGATEPGGVFPLFWTERGIYARSARGLLLCKPDASECSLVYSLDESRFAFAGTAVGRDKALLLVQDHRFDPFETNAKEVHEVDLRTGQGRVLIRLPRGILLKDIDWIDDAGPSGIPAM